MPSKVFRKWTYAGQSRIERIEGWRREQTAQNFLVPTSGNLLLANAPARGRLRKNVANLWVQDKLDCINI